ncbi:MAG: hydrolase [Peptostreptococcaceae bacterium]|nr:hydrolase [Peptostreptococcaceae bacterium]SFE60831.1 Putative N-acetylmannosamine-6-phosphate epimerase [Peptostreptococcaceae bacterium pGA-8]
MDREIPRVTGTLRSKSLQVPDVIWQAKGIVVMGRRIKSVIFSTDVAIIRNCNADGVLAVYPYTPQQIISQTIISASSIPVFAGVGGGTTKGFRVALMAKDAEAQGAYGVVVNAPISNENVKLIRKVIDIPIVVTVVNDLEDVQARLDAGATILNVSAGARTPEIVAHIRKSFPKVPIIATGGPTEESILETIKAGANTISYTPPSIAEIFSDLMDKYRAEAEKTGEPDAGDEELGRMIEIL